MIKNKKAATYSPLGMIIGGITLIIFTFQMSKYMPFIKETSYFLSLIVMSIVLILAGIVWFIKRGGFFKQ